MPFHRRLTWPRKLYIRYCEISNMLQITALACPVCTLHSVLLLTVVINDSTANSNLLVTIQWLFYNIFLFLCKIIENNLCLFLMISFIVNRKLTNICILIEVAERIHLPVHLSLLLSPLDFLLKNIALSKEHHHIYHFVNIDILIYPIGRRGYWAFSCFHCPFQFRQSSNFSGVWFFLLLLAQLECWKHAFYILDMQTYLLPFEHFPCSAACSYWLVFTTRTFIWKASVWYFWRCSRCTNILCWSSSRYWTVPTSGVPEHKSFGTGLGTEQPNCSEQVHGTDARFLWSCTKSLII